CQRAVLLLQPLRCLRNPHYPLLEAASQHAFKYTTVQRGYSNSYKGRDSDGPRNKWFLAFPAICFCLGTWQVYRRQWKLDLIESLNRRTTQPPVIVDGGSVKELMAKSLDDMEFRPVRIIGEFDHDGEVLIGPRHLIDPKSSAGADGGNSLFSSGAGVGYHVITPFRLADSGERVLVNRGWVPAKLADPATRPQWQQRGRVELTGLVRLTEPAGLVGGYLVDARSPANSGAVGPQSRSARRGVTCRIRRDVEALSGELNTLPFFVDACASGMDSSESAGTFPIGGQTRLSLRNEHLSYIVTWYSLGALLLVFWAMRIR
ncbi:hypothetical protein BOX15_Mlig021063g4, partial [Macrostomum lignano]